MDIYVVEIVYIDAMNGNTFESIHYASTFDKAINWLKLHKDGEELKINKVNEFYWEVNKNYDSSYGIMKKTLDAEFN